MLPQTQNTTLTALINLLDEPDEKAFGLIQDQILRRGMDAMEPLEHCLENSFNIIVHDRARSIIRKLNQEKHYNDVLNWIQTASSDLLTGFMLVSKVPSPSLDENEIIYRIEQLKIDIWIELHENLTALENIQVMNHILFEIHHFGGDKTSAKSPVTYCADALLETRKGSPLTLGILFIILAQKLGLPVYGVNLPQHFILAYLSGNDIEDPAEDDVLFYINPVNNGAVFTRREIELYIGQMKIRPERSFFTPCTNTDIIRRLINELKYSYNQTGESDMIEDLDSLLTAFE